MKKLLSVAASAVVIGLAGNAGAVSTTWTDVIDFNPDVLVPPALSYFHNITDDGFSSSWMGGDDTITGYDLSISFYDDNVGTETQERVYLGNLHGWGKLNTNNYAWQTVITPDGNETAFISIALVDLHLVNPDGTATFPGTWNGKLDIYHDGTLNVSIDQWGSGDFYVGDSTLVVYGDDGTAPVPEPTTMLLFGTGIASLAAVGRKRKK